MQSAEALVARHRIYLRQQAGTLRGTRRPQCAPVGTRHGFPVTGHLRQRAPVRPQLLVKQGAHLGPDPGRRVYPVGDGVHLGRGRRIPHGQANPAPHLLADRPVQLAHAIATGGAA